VDAPDGSVCLLTVLLPCRGIDPTALQTCNLFAFVPATTVAAITQLPLPWVELYSGYLYYVAKTFGGAAFQSYVLGGPLLSPDAGGFIANKTIYQWLYGEPSDVMRLRPHSIQPLESMTWVARCLLIRSGRAWMRLQHLCPTLQATSYHQDV